MTDADTCPSSVRTPIIPLTARFSKKRVLSAMEEMTSSNSDKLALVDYYLKLLLKKRWFIIIPFCLAMIGGIYYGITTPERFSAGNLIVVVPKQVPDEYVQALQTTDMSQRIDTIKEQILSRSSLESIMKQFSLYTDEKYAGMYEEDKIANLQRNVRVKVNKSRGGVSSFRISFAGENPQKVRDVVNKLADSFIDESVVIMQQEALETNRFLQGELNAIRAQLELIEKSIEQYRREHAGELPEELPSNLKLIERYQLQLNDKQQSIRDAKNRIAELDNLIAAAKLNAASQQAAENAAKSARDREILQRLAMEKKNEPESELDVMRKKLFELRRRYTEAHPDITRLIEQIESLEAVQAEALKIKDAEEETVVAATDETGETETPAFDKTLFDLKHQHQMLIQEMVTDQNDILEIQKKIAEYQKRVENTSHVELGLTSRQRNYDNIQRNYEKLLDRKLESDIAVNMEKKQKGQKFRQIDRAKIPQKPISPDMKKVFLICLVLGLGSGTALVIGLDFLNTSIKRPEEVETVLETPLLAIVPRITGHRDAFIHRVNQLATLIALGFGGILFCILGIIAVKGGGRTVNFFKGLLS